MAQETSAATMSEDVTKHPMNESDSEGGESRPKRRRRRGKKKTSGAESTGVPSTGADNEHTEDHTSRDDGESNGARRGGKKRSRRSRRGKRSEAPPQDEGDDRSEAPRKRSAPSTSAKAQEIFADQTFADLGIRSSVLKGLEAMGFERPTKVQAAILPPFLEGKDILGQAKTGSGKTAAFGIPVINNATRDLPFQTIILCPTRELAIQLAREINEIAHFTPINAVPVYGGQAINTQAARLAKNPEIVVATPGRYMDMVERGYVHLNNVKFVVLDEVDRMLDIGFREDIRKILGRIKTEHQTLFVSATLSDEIERLARTHMKNDAEKIVTVAGSLTVSMVEQHYLTVEPWDKRSLLLHLLRHEEPALTVVFCRTKATVDKLTSYLSDKGIDAHAIHGDMYQGKRNAVMNKLRDGELGVLVASDLAARGLDVDGISHVVNYDLPEDPEVYIHRIGRTARAGREGVAWSLVSPDQGPLLTAIEQLANTEIPLMDYPDFKPGPVPERIVAERTREAQEVEAMRKPSRFEEPSAPAAPGADSEVSVKDDAKKFPDGIVPKAMPTKRIRGKVRTHRS
ncbi:MAG: DEAD/DEAH box helicase [Phycisphaeraceae bacterium]|nr:DEAD/DEAH box helicase [Phycisphaeraceae bacterium]